MKRYIRLTDESVVEMHLTDLFDSISQVIYVDDIDSHSPMFIEAADYSMYSDEDLKGLPAKDIQDIDDLYTISRIYNIAKNKLAPSQINELMSMYHIDPKDLNSASWKIYIDDSDVQNILNMLKKHNWVAGQGPALSADPDKNFAMKHNLNIGPRDYVHIIHSLTLDECRVITPYLTLSRNKNNLGNNLIVFNVKKEFTLSDGTSIGDFKVYIKIDLTRTMEKDQSPIALISFHE